MLIAEKIIAYERALLYAIYACIEAYCDDKCPTYHWQILLLYGIFCTNIQSRITVDILHIFTFIKTNWHTVRPSLHYTTVVEDKNMPVRRNFR